MLSTEWWAIITPTPLWPTWSWLFCVPFSCTTYTSLLVSATKLCWVYGDPCWPRCGIVWPLQFQHLHYLTPCENTAYINHPLLLTSYCSQLSLCRLRCPLIHKHASSLSFIKLVLIKLFPLSLLAFVLPTLPGFVLPESTECIVADELNSNVMLHYPI